MPTWDATLPVRQGRAVTLWTTGVSDSVENERVFALAGAPGDDVDDRIGTVQLAEADRLTGLLSPSSTPLSMPGGGGLTVRQFGAAMLATDIVDCVMRPGMTTYESCGQELLVGAPDRFVEDTPGKAFLYVADPSTNSGYRWQSTIGTPVTMPLSNGAEFGASFAAPRSPPKVELPWSVSPDPAPWVAIGAPGIQTVFVYHSLDHARKDPLTDAAGSIPPRVVELSGPSPNFGYAMAAGDFDGDGVPDLAIGAPGNPVYDFTVSSSRAGVIYMYWGTTDTTVPTYPFLPPTSVPNPAVNEIDPVHLASLAPNPWYDPVMVGTATACPGGAASPLTCANGGGSTLAAGRVRSADDSRDYLLAGYPSWSRKVGYVCQFVFLLPNASGERLPDPRTKCFKDPKNFSGDRNEFGFAVGWADLNPVDSFGSKSSVESRYLEAAISSPAASGFLGLPSTGRVHMFPSDEDGVNPTVAFTGDIRDNEGEVPNGRFGAFISAGYVHQSPFEDLWIGSPSRGSGSGTATLSLADNPKQCIGASPEGQWTSVDSVPIAQTVRMFNRPDKPGFEIQFPTGYQMRLMDSTNLLCLSSKNAAFTGIIDLPEDASLVLDSRWTCAGPTTQVWTGQNAHDIINQILQGMGIDDKTLDAEVDVTLEYIAPADATLTLTFSKLPTGKLGIDSSCDIKDPIVLIFEEAVCETP